MTNPHPSASLYVGDLAPEVTEGLLFDLFNQVGPVSSIRVCRDAITRRSLGYAYVNFHNVIDAERALDALNNTPIKGRPCRIMWSQRDPSVRKSGVGNVFIKNLDPEIGHKELHDTFSAFGNILSCKVALSENNQSKGYGFVHFESEESAMKALNKVNGKIMGSKKVFVGKFIPRKERLKSRESSWTNVYIKNLDKEITNSELEEMFKNYGPIMSAHVMTGDGEGSKGFGFVNFQNHEDATKAVEHINSGSLKNKEGVAYYAGRAQKKAERKAELQKKFEQFKIDRINKYQGINLYLKNLDDDLTEDKLRNDFSPFGFIRSVKIMTDDRGNSKGFGFVCFNTPEEAQRAINEMNGRPISGFAKPLYVNIHEPKELRRQKLAAQYAARYKGIRSSAIHQGAPALYGPGGAPLFYPPPNIQSTFVYPQVVPRQRWVPPVPSQNQQFTVPSIHRSIIPGSAQRQPRGGARPPPAHSGPAARRNNRVPAKQPLPDNFTEMQFFAEELFAMRPDQQKLYIGEKLYPLVRKKEPEVAGKITGMLLESVLLDDLLHLLENEEALNVKISEAFKALEEVQTSQKNGVDPVEEEIQVDQ